MAAEPSGRARACFDLKRTTFPLFSLVLRTTNLAELQDEFQMRLGDAPEFFEQDLLVLNLSAVQQEENDLDFDGLLALLRSYNLQPIGVHGGSPAQMAAAARSGLVPTPEVSVASSMARAEGRPLAAGRSAASAAAVAATSATSASGPAAAITSAATPSAARQPTKAPAKHATAPAATATAVAGSAAEAAPEPASPFTRANTLVIDRPLRSGQRVYAKDADLVVLEMVSFGAEVIADGNIHVYAPLRGRAIAGGRGNIDARIFTTCFDPQLVAIAGVYRTIETALPEDVAGKPAQIRLVGDSLLIEPL